MATYKVPQDVEAEDKLLGPLTFRQFIYAMVGFGLSFFSYLGFQAHWSIGVIPLPFVFVFMLLAFYKREDQPVEAFVAAFLRFYFLPRKRIWNRAGHTSYVKITAPKRKKPEPTYRTASEARSQLKTLAQIVDTRGWSSKQSELQLPNKKEAIPLDDRLVIPDFQGSRDPVDIHNSDDVFEEGNKTANVFNELSKNAQNATRQEAVAKMQEAIESSKHTSEPKKEDADEPVISHAREENPKYDPYPEGFHPKKVVKRMKTSGASTESSSMTKGQRADILELSQNDGLSLEELAKHAQRLSAQNQQTQEN